MKRILIAKAAVVPADRRATPLPEIIGVRELDATQLFELRDQLGHVGAGREFDDVESIEPVRLCCPGLTAVRPDDRNDTDSVMVFKEGGKFVGGGESDLSRPCVAELHDDSIRYVGRDRVGR